MKMLRLAVCLSVMFLMCSCSGGGSANFQTPVGTPVSLTVLNGFFKGYSTAGTQLGFANMTGSVRFNNMTGINSRGRCTGSYTIVAAGPTIFENLSTTKSSTSLAVQPGPTIPLSIVSQIPTSVVSQRYFLLSNGNLYKITNAPGTLSYLPANFTMPPNPANVGQSGAMATLTGNDGSTLDIGWELSPEFNGNSIMIITSITRSILQAVTAIEVDKFYLDRAGNPYKFGITYTTGGVTVTLTGNKT